MPHRDLDRWHAELREEFKHLNAAHQALELRPKDTAGHQAHMHRLHLFRERLHEYMDARGSNLPRSTVRSRSGESALGRDKSGH